MSQHKTKVSVDISWMAIAKVLLVTIGIGAAFALRDILFMMFVVFIFVAGVSPIIKLLQRHMSRTLAVILFFFVLLLGFGLLFYVFVPLMIEQLSSLLNALPGMVEKGRIYLSGDAAQRYSSYIDQIDSSFNSLVNEVTNNVFATSASFFSSAAAAVTGLILAFYLLLEEKNAREFFHQVLPHDKFEAVYTTVRKISGKMGDWIQGQLLLMLIIGVCNFVVFMLIGLPSPFVLGIWAGVCEVIPYFGPFLGVVPALLIAFAGGSYTQVILVFLLNFILIQQVEANILVPKLMGRAVGLSPVLVILSLAIGLKLFGILGAIVSLPMAAIVSVVFGEWSNLRSIWEKDGDTEVV